MALVTAGGETYSIDARLKIVWDKIKDGKLAQNDDDRVYCVDGRERSGKSLFTLQQACYIDPTLLEDYKKRIVYSPQALLNAIRTTKSTKEETKVIIFDEAFRGFSSRAAVSQTNKRLVQAFMEMGQQNLVIFVVMPTFFMLDQYVAMHRSECLFHITRDGESGKRTFRVFNHEKKKKLYLFGKPQAWSYKKPHTSFYSEFYGKYPGGKDFEAKYRLWKNQALLEMDEENPDNDKVSYRMEKYMEKRRILIGLLAYIVRKHKLMTQEELTVMLNKVGDDAMRQQVSSYYGELMDKRVLQE